jgi:ribonuclease R
MASERTERGRIEVTLRGFGFLETEDGRSAFVSPPDLNAFLAGDIAEAALLIDERGRWSAHDLRLVSRARTTLYGAVVARRGQLYLQVDRTVANTDWPLDGAAEVGSQVVARIDGPRATVTEVVSDHDAALRRVMVRYGLSDYATDADFYGTAVHPGNAVRDLRHVVTVTIDAPSTRDIDDAISVLEPDESGAIRVLISIADVDSVVARESSLDLEARQRGTSVYLAGRVLPMLPRQLSEDALSLLPERERRVLTCELRVDPVGNVTSVDLYEALIRSNARVSYDEVTAFLDHGNVADVAPELRPTLLRMRTVAARLGVQRSLRGGIAIDRDENAVHLDEETATPVAVSRKESTSAHLWIERLMVAANEAVAQWLIERGVAALFRVHDAPTSERVQALEASARQFGFEPAFGAQLTPLGLAAFEVQFRGTDVAPALYQVLSRLLGPARYQSRPTSHFGLASSAYLHFTSPIRRYADLVVHRAVKRYLRGERNFLSDESELDPIALHLNERTHVASKAERERLRSLFAQFYATRIGECDNGDVIALKPFGAVVQLRASGAVGTIAADALGKGAQLDPLGTELRGERSLRLGMLVTVKIAAVDVQLGRIELSLA